MNVVTFNNERIIREYIARLYETYPEVPDMKNLEALENSEKKNLEDNCE